MIDSENRTLQQTIKMIVFVAMLFGILIYSNHVLNTTAVKYDSTDTRIADGCDVIFAGTSQSFYAVNPQLLWDEHGIASYNFSAMAQYIGITYYSLVDIFKYQTPKVLILDYESIERPSDFQVSSNMLYSLPTIHDLALRYEVYDTIIGEDTPYFVPLLRYHGRWKELSKADFIITNNHYNLGSGILTHSGNTNDTLPYVYEDVIASEIGEEELYYLELIYELTKNNDCSLVLVDYPSYSTDSVAPITAAVKEWAEKKEVDYLNFNNSDIYNQMNLATSDFADVLHLNIHGANKASHYLGDWLLDTFPLPDRREDQTYAYWEEKVAASRKLINSRLLPTITDLDEYFAALEKGDYTIIIAATGTYADETYGGASLQVNGNEIYYASGDVNFSYFMKIDSNDLSLIGGPSIDENGNTLSLATIMFNKTYCNRVTNGINVLVYDNILEDMVEAVGFDSDKDFMAVR